MVHILQTTCRFSVVIIPVFLNFSKFLCHFINA